MFKSNIGLQKYHILAISSKLEQKKLFIFSFSNSIYRMCDIFVKLDHGLAHRIFFMTFIITNSSKTEH